MRSVLILLLLLPSVCALEWSEIYFDPLGSDNGLEYIEFSGVSSLEGCTIRDSASEDALTLLKEGSATIMIVEEDSTYYETGSATYYSAGKAIGNGLSNTAEELTLVCPEFTLETAYDIASMPDWEPGYSIVWNGEWMKGSLNGTPGIHDTIEEKNLPESPQESTSTSCNATLMITTTSNIDIAGEQLTFTIHAQDVAAFSVYGSDVLLEGDTLRLQTYTFTLPSENVTIKARAEQCDAVQRATQKIEVLVPPAISNMLNESSEPKEEKVTESEKEFLLTTNTHHNQTSNLRSSNDRSNSSAHTPTTPPQATGHVVYDTQTSAIPWVSGFGIITLLVSSGLFLHMREKGEI